jgi:hypothetical protein
MAADESTESTESTQDLPAIEEQPAPPPQSPLGAQRAAEPGGPSPEVLVGGAFAGGFVLAKLLKRLGGGD